MSLPGSPQHDYELAGQHWIDEQNRQAEEFIKRQRKEEARRKEKERQRKKQAKECKRDLTPI